MARGRKTKLTPQTREIILRAIRDGYTLAAAARFAGAAYRTLWFWQRQFPNFRNAIISAQKEAVDIKIKGNPRALSRARYEQKATPQELTQKAYKEIMRTMKDGRVPYGVAVDALALAAAELEDMAIEQSVSWAEDPKKAKVHEDFR
jgi:hypothetical protein